MVSSFLYVQCHIRRIGFILVQIKFRYNRQFIYRLVRRVDTDGTVVDFFLVERTAYITVRSHMTASSLMCFQQFQNDTIFRYEAFYVPDQIILQGRHPIWRYPIWRCNGRSWCYRTRSVLSCCPREFMLREPVVYSYGRTSSSPFSILRVLLFFIHYHSP
jgi:hypothetical protein